MYILPLFYTKIFKSIITSIVSDNTYKKILYFIGTLKYGIVIHYNSTKHLQYVLLSFQIDSYVFQWTRLI